MVYWDLGAKQKALDYYTQALPLARAVQDPLSEAGALIGLMRHEQASKDLSLAIFFGKEAIDRFQQLTLLNGGTGKENALESAELC